MYKILITEPEYFPEDVVVMLKQIGNVVARRIKREELLNEIKDADVLIVRVETLVDKPVLENATKLKIIASPTTGTDHIDLEYAKLKGIEVINAPGLNAIATAEHTFGLILSLIRKIPNAYDEIKKFAYRRSEFLGIELNGKIMGVIGFGRTGSQVAKYARAFGMKILTYDPFLNQKIVDEIGAEPVSLDELLRKSDIITLHAFGSPENENMISHEEFSKMKKTAFLINVARGSLIDEDALIGALKNKMLKGAAIDVLREEPPSKNNALIAYAQKNSNLIITPHLGGSTEESIRNAALYVTNKIKESIKKW